MLWLHEWLCYGYMSGYVMVTCYVLLCQVILVRNVFHRVF